MTTLRRRILGIVAFPILQQHYAVLALSLVRPTTLLSSSSILPRCGSPLRMSSGSDQSRVVSVAILGGGISGLSCASHLLESHERQSREGQPNFRLEVTVFDTGRLRPGGRCSSPNPN
mmetsp:Transcript_11286/g.23770  ORF Transcript_11286/g.23770 Transcript_11286/m.23770 type:complete len:118 (-) Transcript_11286:1787-2140(-)